MRPQVGYTVVSMIFIANYIVRLLRAHGARYHSLYYLQGFVTGAVLNVWLTDRFGFGTVSTRNQI